MYICMQSHTHTHTQHAPVQPPPTIGNMEEDEGYVHKFRWGTYTPASAYVLAHVHRPPPHLVPLSHDAIPLLPYDCPSC